jgi:acyl-CoA synthetase (NDP forming)
MRVIGPNCMGVVNTDPAVRMNATFAPSRPVPGHVAFASQSGGLGIALLGQGADRGLGISAFVSMGNKADVSSNDLIQYWEDDPNTSVILLYLESFGNPRKFARLARRISRTKPIVAVKSGRTPAGARGTASHTAALATPDVAVNALFRQAGVVRVETLAELFDAATLLSHQPLPAGRRVAIVSNGGGPGILAADACVAVGLEVVELSAETQEALHAITAPGAGLRNPVDLVASASADVYEAAIRIVLADPDVDAVVVLFVPPLVTEAAHVAQAIVAASEPDGDGPAKPVVACFLVPEGRIDVVSDDGRRRIPTFDFPEAAAVALERAARLAEWRARPEGTVPVLPGIDLDRARALVAQELTEAPDGRWVAPVRVRQLLECFGVTMVATEWVADADAAVQAAEAVGYPVALKAGAADLVHKSDVGGVQLHLADADAVRRAFTAMHDALGDGMGGAVVQPMVDEGGVETIVGITRDALFGSLVLFGMGGIQAELARDTAVRFVPLTDVDAQDLVRGLRSSPLLFGYRNTPPVDVTALEETLLRVGLLAEHVPEVAEFDANPVIASPTGTVVLDAKLHLVRPPAEPPPELRRLRPTR